MAEGKITPTDYFSTLVALADTNDEINSSALGKPLEAFLAKRFSISPQAVIKLLSRWETEGRIQMVKNPLRKEIQKIRIIAADLFSDVKPKNKILVLLDWKNLTISLDISSSERFSLTAALDRFQRQLTEEVGEIASVFVFGPNHLSSLEAEAFYQEGFPVVSMILCPLIKPKGQEEKPVKRRDTTDEILIEFMSEMTNLMPSITHICLGSGDKDFVRAVRKAMRKRLKIILAVGDLTPLASELSDLADINPITGKKMIYVLSQVKD